MIITQTPLRVSLAGGGTDFPKYYNYTGHYTSVPGMVNRVGCVVSMAIDKYIYVIGKPRFDDKIVVNYTKTEVCDSSEEVQHDLVRECLIRTGINSCFEITTIADIPSEGTGLGSSSSLTVGLLNMMYTHQGIQKDSEALAREACEIEIDVLKRPIGKQDQYIAAYGGLKNIMFHAGGKVSIEDIKSPQRKKLVDNLMLFYTGKTRQSSMILQEQNSRIEENWHILDAMAYNATTLATEIRNGNINAVGYELFGGWENKKKLASSITSPQIDRMYTRAVCAGAIGGKIAGAGGGGFLLVYAEEKYKQDIRKELEEYRELSFGLSKHGSRVILNMG